MADRILITGARAPAALDLARSFTAAGFETHLADATPCLMARLSRLPAPVHAYAAPRQDPAAFARDLNALIERLDPLLVVPACEEIFHLAALATRRGWAGRLFVPSPAMLHRLHSKSRFAELAVALGLAVPQTHRLTDPGQLAAFTGSSQDWVFKPDYSRFGAEALIGPSSQVAGRLCPSPVAPLVVQKRVMGDEISFYAVAFEGRLAAFSAYRSNWRLSGGASYAFEPASEVVASPLRGMAQVLAREIVNGQFACDAMIDASGAAQLIECNPRATSGVHLFTRGPGLALAMLGGAPVDSELKPRHLAPALWRYGLLQAASGGEWRRWRDQRRLGVDVISAPGDRAPILGALADSLIFSAAAALAGRSLAAQMTQDIEWNGEDLGRQYG